MMNFRLSKNTTNFVSLVGRKICIHSLTTLLDVFATNLPNFVPYIIKQFTIINLQNDLLIFNKKSNSFRVQIININIFVWYAKHFITFRGALLLGFIRLEYIRRSVELFNWKCYGLYVNMKINFQMRMEDQCKIRKNVKFILTK